MKEKPTTREARPIVAIAFDGGGIRGKYQLAICRELEKRLPKPLYHYLDYVAGVSTGAISAGCIASGKLSCEQALKIYDVWGERIFDKKWYRLSGIFFPKYKRSGFDGAFDEYLGGIRYGDVKCKMLAVSVRTDDVVSYSVFKSTKTEHKDMFLKDVVAKSASAPSYFAADQSNNRIDVDGGMAENNPSMVALVEMINKEESDSYFIISIGTGLSEMRLPKKHIRWGKAGWIKKITDLCLQQNSAMTTYYMETLASSKNIDLSYHRFNGKLVHASPDIDDASFQNLKNLHEDAMDYVLSKEISEQLDEIANTLKILKP